MFATNVPPPHFVLLPGPIIGEMGPYLCLNEDKARSVWTNGPVHFVMTSSPDPPIGETGQDHLARVYLQASVGEKGENAGQ